MRSFLRSVLGLSGAVVLLGSCGAKDPVMTTDVCISTTFCATNFVFTPTSATRAQGATIAWGNNASTTHNVTFDNAAAASAAGLTPGDLAAGTILTRVVTAKGTFPFHCSIHPQMTGTLTIQ